MTWGIYTYIRVRYAILILKWSANHGEGEIKRNISCGFKTQDISKYTSHLQDLKADAVKVAQDFHPDTTLPRVHSGRREDRLARAAA